MLKILKNFKSLIRSNKCCNIIPKRCYSKVETVTNTKYIVEDLPTKLKKRQLPWPKYGGQYLVTLLTGENGVGQKGKKYLNDIINTAKIPINFECLPAKPKEEKLSPEYLMSLQRNHTAVHIDLENNPFEKQKNFELNRKCDLYACVLKFKTYEGFKCLNRKVDIMLIIQNNAGDFSKLEYEPVKGVVETLRICTENEMIRYLMYAFNHAIENKRKKVTVCHKADIFQKSDTRFVEIAQQIQKQKFSQIELEVISIDQLVRSIITNPQDFDVVCSTERFGTILGSITGAVCGGAGLHSIMDVGDHFAVFKPLQTKLSITDQPRLQPYGIIKCCSNMLHFLHLSEHAEILDEAFDEVMELGIKTPEFGGCFDEDSVIECLLQLLKKRVYNCESE